MTTSTPPKKSKLSLSARRKKNEEKLLRMTDDELAKEMLGTLSRVAEIIKKRS